ncbi:hypothetical protein J43TS3_31910 [Ornithinibacillus bavariensis]|uniref:Uncharacterized protein n=1 Tax=Ornithinibacillus bavariensis TaxID=545502 RepID=A0A919XDE7_9BACI|nr:hypothetical protein J43TS3_31910 [Ornithinibacillus bavariensis]
MLTPDSPLFEELKNDVRQRLEYEIHTQAEDGHFILNWHCDEESARVWKSIWTLDVLALKQHGMIENIN